MILSCQLLLPLFKTCWRLTVGCSISSSSGSSSRKTSSMLPDSTSRAEDGKTTPVELAFEKVLWLVFMFVFLLPVSLCCMSVYVVVYVC